MTRDLASQETPGQEQGSEPGAADHRTRRPAGSVTELLSWSRADLSAPREPTSGEVAAAATTRKRRNEEKAEDRVLIELLRRCVIANVDGPGING